jgi:hypothetical protein
MKITKVTEAGRQHLAVGSWHLAVGTWQLALGTWHLAIRHEQANGYVLTARLSLLASGIVKFMCGPVAQLDRANGYEPLGREFESLRAHHRFSTVELKLASRDLGAYGHEWPLFHGGSCFCGRDSQAVVPRHIKSI